MSSISTHATLPNNLTAHWTLDEASGARVDSTANNNDLTDNNTVGAAAAVIDDGADFIAGNSEYLSITDGAQSGLDFSASSTFNMWVKPDATPTGGAAVYLYAKTGVGTGNRGYSALYFDNGGTPTIQLFGSSDGTTFNSFNHAITLSLVSFTMLTFVIDTVSGEFYLYANGSLVGTDATGLSAQWGANNKTFTLGAYSDGNQFWDGIIDEVGVWSRALTSSEITDLYNSGAGLPYISTNTTVSPAAQSLTFSLPAETVTGEASVSVAAQVANFSLPAETIQANWKVNVNTQVATFSLPEYIITAGGIVLAPNTQALTFSLPAETVLGNAIVSPDAQSLTFTLPVSVVTADWKVSVEPVVLTITLPTLQFVGTLWGRTARATTGADWTRSVKNNDA